MRGDNEKQLRTVRVVCTKMGCGRKSKVSIGSAIKVGWRVWYSDRDGLGERALRPGEALCPIHGGRP